MTFTEKVKEEILKSKISQPCCQVAALSSFVRGAGTLTVSGGSVGFEAISENSTAIEMMSSILRNVFGSNPKLSEFSDKLSGKIKHRLTLVDRSSLAVLSELGIITASESGAEINLGIDKYLIENDCCKRSYIVGAFVGGGSVTVPSESHKSSTSYHLEFVFSKYQTASDFAELLSSVGFMPKLTERKENYIIYFKNGDEISDLLYFMGAKKAGFELKDLIIKKGMNNYTNRKLNCDMGNINKQIEASLKQVADIELIDETIGLESLPLALQEAAKLRLDNRDATLDEMAKLSGLTKSCLNHRLRKIAEIAKNL